MFISIILLFVFNFSIFLIEYLMLTGNKNLKINFTADGYYSANFKFGLPYIQINESVTCKTLYQTLFTFEKLEIRTTKEDLKIPTGIVSKVSIDPSCYDYANCVCSPGYINKYNSKTHVDCLPCIFQNMFSAHANCPGVEYSSFVEFADGFYPVYNNSILIGFEDCKELVVCQASSVTYYKNDSISTCHKG